MSAFDAMRPVLEELRALGVRVRIRAGLHGGLSFDMRAKSEWSLELSRQVAEVLNRHGMREYAEGSWVSANATADQIRDIEESARADDEYKRAREAVREHPDWTAEEIAETYRVPVEEINNIRNQE